MANPLQRAVVRRQLTYLGCIVLLLTLSLFIRGKLKLSEIAGKDVLANESRVVSILNARRIDDYSAVPPPSSSLHKVTDVLASRTILEQSSREALNLREVDQGNAQVDAAFVRLMLTGSRGFVVTALWTMAQRYQMRNEFHKLEQTVNAVTQLQPNFTTPWLFQSWNISYNVSVENDRMADMYYFIARGIELLAKGESINKDSPDMRYYIAFYYQNKFSVSDKVTTLRSQFQISCIKPSERNPDRFRDPVTKRMSPAQVEEFQQFMRKNPRLTRRLYDFYQKQKERKQPVEMMDLVRFLEENERVPTRYDKDKQDSLFPNHLDQFPALPDTFPEGPDEASFRKAEYDDTFDAFLAARAWFVYSTTVLPPPDPEPEGFRMLTPKEKFKYRIPKAPMMIIFRQGGNRSQTYLAEWLQKEGWFDGETRWAPERWLGDEKLACGTSSRDAWQTAYNMWSAHGEANGLKFSPEQLTRLRELAANVPADERLAYLSDEALTSIGITREQLRARNVLRIYERNRTNTNYGFFLSQSAAEADPQTVQARQKLYDAEESRQAGRNTEAIDRYTRALADWRQILLKHEEYSHADKPEEDHYEAQINLVRLLENEPEILARGKAIHLAVQALIPTAGDGVTPFPFSVDLTRELSERESNLRIASMDPRVRSRADVVLILPDAKDWPAALKWQRYFAGEAFRKANPAASEADRAKASDAPEWRAKALAILSNKTPAVLSEWPDLALARDEVSREVVTREFDWLPDYRSPFKDANNRWISETSIKVVRDRLNLSRPRPAGVSNTPAY